MKSFRLHALVALVIVTAIAGVPAATASGTAVDTPTKSTTSPERGVEPLFESTVLATSGQGADTYRIPALEVLPDGTLIAAYDQRPSQTDLPGDIEVVIRRSFDNGRTWTTPEVIVAYDGEIGAGDPSLLVDNQTGRIFLFHAYAPPGVGYWNSSKGNDNDSTSTLHTDYVYSDDGGETWTHRRITKDIKDPDWNGIFASSGTGTQLTSGRHAGRLLQQYVMMIDGQHHTATAYSDDHGRTWHMSEPVGPHTNESEVVGLSDGRVMLNSRPASGSARLVAYSTDGGASYGQIQPDDELIDPSVNAGLIRYDETAAASEPESHWLLFSNPASTTSRENLTVRMSCDDGKHWPISRVVDPGAAAYSTMVRLKDGTFGLLYEDGGYQQMRFVRFNAAWLGADCPAQPGRFKGNTSGGTLP